MSQDPQNHSLGDYWSRPNSQNLCQRLSPRRAFLIERCRISAVGVSSGVLRESLISNALTAAMLKLFNDPDIDAVYIATPHTYHKDQSIAALRAGKTRPSAKKPATVTPEELEEVLAVAETQQRYFMEGMWSYFFPVIQKAQQWGRCGPDRNSLPCQG